MGVRIHALVEYDKDGTPPFSTPPDATIDFTHDTGLYAGKDHAFIAAISGFRNDVGIPVAIPPRGLPAHVSAYAAEHIGSYFGPSDPGVGWLLLSEVERC